MTGNRQSPGLRITGTNVQCDVECPECGAINRLWFDFTNPSKRQVVSCAGQFGVSEKGGCGNEFVFYAAVTITGHTAAIGDYKTGEAIYHGRVGRDDEAAGDGAKDYALPAGSERTLNGPAVGIVREVGSPVITTPQTIEQVMAEAAARDKGKGSAKRVLDNAVGKDRPKGNLI